ncbi:MAG TPA: hypothetical protein VKX33_00120 [Cyclobacteriaceae bacterium]|nr:hypothetical protein [Cyclobacteriaceae bacterium]
MEDGSAFIFAPFRGGGTLLSVTVSIIAARQSLGRATGLNGGILAEQI